VALLAAQHALAGFEFAHGIPGTVGGGVYMNAGAYGGELKDVISSVRVLDTQGNICALPVEDCEFTYRNSLFQKDGSIILGAEFSLTMGEENAIREQMAMLMTKRRATQPLEYPSAGSTFKRPKQGYAAALIENTGLKGLRVGDAAVSEKHAGFVINCGNATASDVLALMQQVQEKVLATTGVVLEPEVRILK
jgi:UDP-N-acetylmuramate dehydrogenase